MDKKAALEDYTEAEFLKLIVLFFEGAPEWNDDVIEQAMDDLIDYFILITGMGTDVLFHPAKGVEDSPEGVLKSVKEWRAAKGLPGFKPA